MAVKTSRRQALRTRRILPRSIRVGPTRGALFRHIDNLAVGKPIGRAETLAIAGGEL